MASSSLHFLVLQDAASLPVAVVCSCLWCTRHNGAGLHAQAARARIVHVSVLTLPCAPFAGQQPDQGACGCRASTGGKGRGPAEGAVASADPLMPCQRVKRHVLRYGRRGAFSAR